MSELDGTELVDWRQLPPAQRRGWWEQLWDGAIALAERYRLALRTGWWDDALQVEALAAFYAWLRLYDTGAYTDPPGKLQLLWELERLRAVVRAGDRAFDPDRDRRAFEAHLDAIEDPRPHPVEAVPATDESPRISRRQLADELAAVMQRLAELCERHVVLTADLHDPHQRRNGPPSQAEHDLDELERAVSQLTRRELELRHQLGERRGS
jgi:hypothetical protein